MATIYATNFGKLVAVEISDDDLQGVSQFSWMITPDGYCKRREWDGTCWRWISLHRSVCAAQAGEHVDHANSNKLDCRRENLRAVTPQQNAQNRRGAMRTSASGVRGVHWNPHRNNWRAVVRHEGKTHSKSFEDLVEAGEWAEEKRRQLGFLGA